MENRKKIQEAVWSSTLSDKEKSDLLLALLLLDDTEQGEICNLLNEEKNLLHELSENLQAKKIALLAKNPDLWNSIISKEESDIAKLA